jgi:hypothetical protein
LLQILTEPFIRGKRAKSAFPTKGAVGKEKRKVSLPIGIELFSSRDRAERLYLPIFEQGRGDAGGVEKLQDLAEICKILQNY